MFDQDSNGEIDGQEAIDAINYIIEHINQFYWMDLMTEAIWSWKIIWNSELNFVFDFISLFDHFCLKYKNKQSIKSISIYHCK